LCAFGSTVSVQADIYDPHERGTMVGIYYLFPVLGPSVGTLLGGALSLTKPQWRTTFWFMFAYSAAVCLWACFFQDTFRKERSLAWRAAYKRAKIAAKLKDELKKEAAFQNARNNDGVDDMPSANRKLPWSRTVTKNVEEGANQTGRSESNMMQTQNLKLLQDARKKLVGGGGITKVVTETGEEIPIKVHLRDIK
jgi:MFS family permease